MRRSKLNFASIVLSDVLRSGYNYCRELVIHKTITQLLHKNAFELSHSILTWFQVLSRQPFSFLCYTVTGHFYNWAMSPLSFLSTFTFWLEPGWRTGDYCDTISTLCLTSPGSGVCTVSDRWMAPQTPGDNSDTGTSAVGSENHFRPANESSCRPVEYLDTPDMDCGHNRHRRCVSLQETLQCTPGCTELYRAVQTMWPCTPDNSG